ncbi:MAG: phosphoglycerate mutase [Arenimonas sp.]
MPAGARVLLLPERRRFAGQDFSPAFMHIARRFRQHAGASGESAQLQRHFRCEPDGWPMAALCRQAGQADAGQAQWLFADPAHLQMEMRDARLMAWDTLQLSESETDAILQALAPVFADAGYGFLSGDGRFFLRAAADEPLPAFTPAPEMLGCTLSEHLPADRRWTALFNECQVILYNHPLNVERQRRGMATVNALWFWGQGRLPSTVRHGFARIESSAWDIRALAAQDMADDGGELLDLRQMRDWLAVEAAFDPARETRFDFADGILWRWRPAFRWRFWSRRIPSLS